MKAYIFIALIITITGCSNIPKNKEVYAEPDFGGNWEWENDHLLQALSDQVITSEEYFHEETLALSQCEIESLQVPIPSPSCVQPPRQDCSGLSGFAAGFCKSYTPALKCDYTAVNSAKESQHKIMDSCMKIKGWREVWYRNIDLALLGYDSGSIPSDDLQQIIQSIPMLSHWLENRFPLWDVAVEVDLHMDYKAKLRSPTLRSRFKVVTDIVLENACDQAELHKVDVNFCLLAFPEVHRWYETDSENFSKLTGILSADIRNIKFHKKVEDALKILASGSN